MGWLALAPTTAVAFTQKEEKRALKKRATSATPAPKGRTIDKDGVIHDAKREGSGKRSASGGPTSAGAGGGKKSAAPKNDGTGRGRSPTVRKVPAPDGGDGGDGDDDENAEDTTVNGIRETLAKSCFQRYGK